jgi:poly(3-hydroxybutyrate) depolymerase
MRGSPYRVPDDADRPERLQARDTAGRDDHHGGVARLRTVVAAALAAGSAVLVVGVGPTGELTGPVAVADDLPAGVEQITLGDRAYLLARPERGGAGLPVVVLLHGRTDSASGFLAASGLLDWVGAGAAVVAAPLTAPGLSPTSWNAGSCCDYAARGGVDDVGLVGGVVADVAVRTGADAARASVVGFSNGAMLGYRVACERSGLLAGLVAVAGARLVPCEQGGDVAVLHLHGDSDRAVPVEGTTRPGFTDRPLPSAEESVAAFRGARLEVLSDTGHRFTGAAGQRARAWLAAHALLDVTGSGAAAAPPPSPSS